MEVGRLSPLLSGSPEATGKSLTEITGPTFGSVLRNTLEETNKLQQEADTSARDFAVGQATSVHDTMIAMEKADISLRLVTKMRNKVVEAYQDIMRMPI
jgi:flagellar hook-basal body complex protein FliE